MKKLITIIFVLTTSCASYAIEGIDIRRYSVDVVSEKSFLTILQALISPPVINDSIPLRENTNNSVRNLKVYN